ncbi:MAG: Nif11-like leader peptide family RiPP precursor [Burkholderiales bacterium]
MSVGHIEQFYTRAIQDKALLGKLMAEGKSPEDFINSAVKEGKAMGYDFSHAEADAWIKQQQKIKASGELSDTQLESVAGGGGKQDVGNAISKAGNDTFAAIDNATQTVGNWILSW